MHGYAHNRLCQLSYHPKYVKGAGIEDFETCERTFSISNNCAGISRYTTAFHRLQLIDTHFADSDSARRLAVGKFIYNNYLEASNRVRKLELTFRELGYIDEVRDGTFARYLEEEHKHLLSLGSETVLEQSRFKYVEMLQQHWKAKANWEEIATKEGIRGTVVPWNAPIPPRVKQALVALN